LGVTRKRYHPWPGVALAIIATAAMLLAGANPWLVFGILLVWVGSLWLFRPETVAVEVEPDLEKTSRAVVDQVIEPLGVPLILLEGERIVLANKAARDALGDHITGQDARIVLRHPDAMRLLEIGDGASVTIAGFAGGRSLWQLTRRQVDDRFWLMELLDRTAEADVSRAHTDFVANASHELRTPLAAIIGYVETLAEGGDTVDEATAARFHQTVLREARRMQTLVSDLMSLSQVEAEKHDLPTEEIDFNRLVERAVGEALAIAGKGRVEAEVTPVTMMVRGDRTQLEQLVRNLIDNSLKYGDPAQPVKVSLTDGSNGKAVLTVADRGAGIAAEHIPHLTRRFYRTDPGRSRAAGGTGLGLAIVKHIVERHRGRLDITSKLGVGTKVTVTFTAAESGISRVAAKVSGSLS
jgi:two-component system phosphate regulon sensor histidine kinase PhoR